ncbi:V-type proton ATPase subunit H-like isoform X2 [Amphibalanus amphitrite]|uniref:V-type proton ATPase subunit H-like isoform X2 n=1 Tax=Amphibalanus amphitrite TaxID=1232801 RepID=UPI001C909DA3|nr:V-type proton ATPase subunit H-like isoform X2 [Amphibalanus amphitrite]XP_043221899.1 V-type proton ATPase subunit H-like isoform X2 [Amphibalanus amphitrite]XP_043242649.1 V-type proton ATPase subunit H-like isoform X2 [Amphibalanus amphitrite]
MSGRTIEAIMATLPENAVLGECTGLLQVQAAEIKAKSINWQSYLQSQMISQEDYNFIVAYDNVLNDSAKRNALVRQQSQQCAKTFLNLLGHIAKDQTIQYLLVLIEDMLSDKENGRVFREYAQQKGESVWAPFLTLLNRPDDISVNLTAWILARLACDGGRQMEGSDLQLYITWLKDQLRKSENQYLPTVARCLQLMLRIDEYRFAFMRADGVNTLQAVLSSGVNFQCQYQLVFCLWVLTFNTEIAETISRYNLVPLLADILIDTEKEKVVRMCVATFRNLVDKPESASVSRENAIQMVQCKVLRHLELIALRYNTDEDLRADVDYLTEKLTLSVHDLNSLDEYTTELKSGRLEWSLVHKSDKFWRENASRLNDNNYQLLKILLHLLDTSKDPLVVSVACHDIGEYVRHYPRGKRVLESLDGKSRVMEKMLSDDPNVKLCALLAVQKIMVHNWDYLSKKLAKDEAEAKDSLKNPLGPIQ